jgi:DNA-binding NarL/FixJ family response regulator
VIQVLLVDDHALVRRGFRRLLEDEPDIVVVGEAGDGGEAVRLAIELKPTVVVMDCAMPGMDGVLATHEIRRCLPQCPVLMLSMHTDENYRRGARDAGAAGYLMKDAVDVDLAGAIRRIAAGETYGFQALDQLGEAEPTRDLTRREREIVQLIADGKSNRDIAELLGLSANTIAVHRNNLMHKVRLHRTADLVMYAVRNGLVRVP